MVNLSGTPGVGNIHSKHDTVLTSTPGEPLQGDPDRDTVYPEAYRYIKMVPGIKVALIYCYHPTWSQGPLHPHERGPPPRGRGKVGTD